jgi:hypothetical protein
MNYPTLSEVDAADHEQLGRWYRFLPSPGDTFLRNNGPDLDSVEQDCYQLHLDSEIAIMNRICERFKALGMFTPELSKKVGWVPPG